MRSALLRRAANAGLIGLLVVLTGGAQELPRQWQRQMIHTRAANIEVYTRGQGPAVLMHPGGGGSALATTGIGQPR
jgi:hypothetical protein